MADQWLSIVEYARTYKISDMTVRRRIKTGKLEAVLQDGKYFIPITPNTTPKSTQANSSIESSLPKDMPRLQATNPVAYNNRSAEIQVIKGHPTAPRIYPEPQAGNGIQTPFSTQFSPQSMQGGEGATPHHSSLRTQEKSFPIQNTMPSANNARASEAQDHSIIPSSIRQSLIKYETSLIDSQALISFCEGSLRKIQDGERKVVERFKSKLEALEATLGARDQEIKSLRQQMEDLQLLVKILERRKNSV